MKYFFSASTLVVLFSFGLAGCSVDTAEADTDGDGLFDTKEAALGTNPDDADSDDDGIHDGQEWEMHTDPLHRDSDRDGESDGFEFEHGTNPLVHRDDERNRGDGGAGPDEGEHQFEGDKEQEGEDCTHDGEDHADHDAQDADALAGGDTPVEGSLEGEWGDDAVDNDGGVEETEETEDGARE